jgi:hypothetical protein
MQTNPWIWDGRDHNEEIGIFVFKNLLYMSVLLSKLHTYMGDESLEQCQQVGWYVQPNS